MSFEPREYLRHILAEAEYDYDLVWDVVESKIPTLKSEVERILQS